MTPLTLLCALAAVRQAAPFSGLAASQATRLSACHPSRTCQRQARRTTITAESLGGALFRQVFGGLQEGVSKLSGQAASPGTFRSGDVAAGRAAASGVATEIKSIDARAQSGEVTFEDFLQIGRTFRKLNGRVPGDAQLTAQQIEETLAKFEKHEKIVLAMTDAERDDPQLVLDDLENYNENCPIIQRLAKESGVSERDVALFCAEFEAMRVSTQRIAAGEDPDKVNAEIGSSNRAQRRAAKKGKKRR